MVGDATETSTFGADTEHSAFQHPILLNEIGVVCT